MGKYQGRAKKSLQEFKDQNKAMDNVEKSLEYVNHRDKLLEDVIADVEDLNEDHQELTKSISEFNKRLSSIKKKFSDF